MNNLIILFKGEIYRMKRYNILTASVLVSLIWIGFLHFTKVENVSNIFPLFIYLDVTSMSILMIGVTMFFEKQEGTLKSLLVCPINKVEYILAKSFANISSNIITLFVLYSYCKLFKEIDINIGSLLVSIILISFLHSLIGFILTYYSKDFTQLLVGMMKYAFIFMIPVLLEEVGLIKGEVIKKILYIIPTKAAMVLLKASSGLSESFEVVISYIYLIVVGAILYMIVLKKFDEFSIKESGV
ncbi:fluoroquinolone transport system permease protein [Alkalithermobacter thermoalcaliphilus JW-YL-7 = DSM 7308]|uniref:ABC transporter permease n=1 Tax=Alkalithermobacter thermoalcaliphilus JW-YL-7 = DSM 7308 TaxID=1121328 RepID=A0A150FP64_CLOPD|nr:ABC transporter permease [[Clostridium] paradoxum JW-YL-7 = DSM 7308]SHK54422.1 fluoroquinolone transport system permease protein [[Clostridium] paradoxum JW-YL-7 = DSM 7308]